MFAWSTFVRINASGKVLSTTISINLTMSKRLPHYWAQSQDVQMVQFSLIVSAHGTIYPANLLSF